MITILYRINSRTQVNSKIFPITIAAKATKLLKLTLPMSGILSDTTLKQSKDGHYTRYLGIVYQSIDFNTRRHYRMAPSSLKIHIKKDTAFLTQLIGSEAGIPDEIFFK